MSELMAQAEKKLKGGFMTMFTGTPYDEAIDLFEQAANRFKLGKEWESAAEAFQRCVYCLEKQKGPRFQIANYHLETGHCLKKMGIKKALQAYEKTIQMWQNDGKIANCGKLLKEIAEGLENEQVGKNDAELIERYYERACDMFEMDDHGKSQLSNCKVKLAEFAANAGNYKKAIEIYESEAEACLQNNLRKYGAKDLFFRAGILHMVEGDVITMKIAHERYVNSDPRYKQSREGTLYEKLLKAYEAENRQDFVNALAEYNEISTLEAWYVKYLTMAKEHLEGEKAITGAKAGSAVAAAAQVSSGGALDLS